MKELFLQKRFDILLLMVAAFFPIYKYSFSAVLLPVFGVAAIVMYLLKHEGFDRQFFAKQKVQYFLVTVAFYLIMLLSIVYTSNLKAGVSNLVRSVYIIAYPFIIIFFVKDIPKKQAQYIFICFLTACIVYLFFVHYQFFAAGLYTNFKSAEYNDLPFREVIMGLNFGSMHPTYISMWFLFCTLCIIHYLMTHAVPLHKILILVLVICLFVVTSVLVSVKITVLAFFFALLVLIYLKQKNKLVILGSFFVLATIFIFSIFNVSFLRARFIDEFQVTVFEPPVGLNTNSLNIRVGIYQCAVDVFKGNWFIGIGVGDTQDELNKCYKSFNTNVYTERNYDTHNNYLEIAVGTGIIGLFSFLYMLWFHTRESIRHHNDLFIVFLVFISICMLPENILSRNHGVVFYAIFSSLFLKINLDNVADDNIAKG